MTRLMSVSHTEAQVVAGTKTVTRRLGWQQLKAGDHLMLCRKVMGRRRRCSRDHPVGDLIDSIVGPACYECQGTGYVTEPLVKLREVVVVSAFREPLDIITRSDVAAEGFPEWTPEQFVDFFCLTFKVKPDRLVTRIEWRYL